MPIYDEPAAPASISRVSPSAALELFWITFRCEGGGSPAQHPILDPRDHHAGQLARRTREFWAEGDQGFPEVIIIASRRGLLAGDSLAEFLTEIPVSALRTDDLTLASETAETRAMIVERLERLAAEPALRRRYLALLRELWEAVRQDWETNGRPAVLHAVAAAERRLAAGEHPADLAPKVSEPSLDLLRRHADAEILVCPGYFTGRCVWELPGILLLGFQADGSGELTELRARAEFLAQRLKALADPTRLAILLRLGDRAASMTDITREFGISQPAVSNHFRVLREAEMVAGERVGSRTVYRVDRQRAGALLEELSGTLSHPVGAP